MQKLLFIYNPTSGKGRVAEGLSPILDVFTKSGWLTTAYPTQHKGDAARIVRELGHQYDRVVCAGGDGTLSETVTGMIESGVKVPVGYIPAGSTNDFASSLKLSTNIMQAAQDIVDGVPVSYDVGKFGDDRYFSYVASFGAFTKSSYSTPQNVKNALGHTAYILESIQELSQIRKVHVRMELEDTVVEDDFVFGCISNSTSIGGILTLDPKQVDMADGLMEVFLVRAPKNLVEISQCIQAIQSQQYNNCAMITFCPTRKVKVFVDEPLTWTLDGERAEGMPEIVVENLRHAMRLVQRVKEHA